MINSIVEAISCSLNKEFGDDYEIHNEEIKQAVVRSISLVRTRNMMAVSPLIPITHRMS